LEQAVAQDESQEYFVLKKKQVRPDSLNFDEIAERPNKITIEIFSPKNDQ
jgi:hypothetical protein